MFKNMSFINAEAEEIQRIAQDALRRQGKIYTKEEEKINLIEERLSKIDYGAIIFEEYDNSKWESKVKIESNIYNQLVKNLEESDLEKIQTLLGDLLLSVNDLYEHVNIAPQLYSTKINLEDSENTIVQETDLLIETFLSKKHYSLSTSERNKLYMDATLNLSKDIITNESIDIKEAVEHSYKSLIMQKLIEEVNFPKTVYYRLQELMESPLYGEIFEQDKLIEKWDNFKEKSNTLSRVFAALV
jgi:hypothetical protein